MRQRFFSSIVAASSSSSSSSTATTATTTVTTCESLLPRLRIVAFNDVYDLYNLARLQTFLKETPNVNAVVLAGDFVSPSPLSALDQGKGAIATLRAVGITHASLGNHEADLKLGALRQRLSELVRPKRRKDTTSTTTTTACYTTRGTVVLNSNVGDPMQQQQQQENSQPAQQQQQENSFLSRVTKPYDIVTTDCGRVRVAFLGLLSDEPGIFRDGTFRGLSIANVESTLEEMHRQLIVERNEADWILPLTHQSIHRDTQLAHTLLRVQSGESLIIGGHEHTPTDVQVRMMNEKKEEEEKKEKDDVECHDNNSVRILKSGMDARGINLIDLTFSLPQQKTTATTKLESMQVTYVDLQRDYEPSLIVQGIIDSHMSLLTAMEHEHVLHADALIPTEPLSSQGTRYQQTTVGAVFGLAVKEELNADVALINGATIKGNKVYDSPHMTYAQLKQELPFPTKIVVVPMKRGELLNAIDFSRTQNPPRTWAENETPVERKGYLQVDLDWHTANFGGWEAGGHADDLLQVAVPRNLLNGFCDIKPLMAVGERLKQEGAFPVEEAFYPALNLVVRHFSKERWYELLVGNQQFTDLDIERKGYLTRDDIIELLRRSLQHEPPEFLVNDMMAVVDADDNGVIDPGEFSHLLATMEREHKQRPFASSF